MGKMNTLLMELARLWVQADDEAARRIPEVCACLEKMTADRRSAPGFHSNLPRSIMVLADRGLRRLEDCLLIQLRTGAYSRGGTLETAPRAVISDWEG